MDYGAVQLGDGRMRDQFRHQHALFRDFDSDRLLKPFRSRAGQPAPGADMGGWYDDSRDFHVDPNDWSTLNWHGYIPGHSFGQYVSGLARSYAVTGDTKTRDTVRTLVLGYVPTISPKFFQGHYLPAYTYDKLAIGLIDAYRYADLTEAKGALDALTDAVLPFLPEKALTREERRQRPYTSEAEIWDEPYTLPENLFIAWRSGMGDRYRDLAVRYLQDEALFDPLAAGKSPFKGKHAYSHVNALNSAVQAYLATGDEKYLNAARNGFAFIEAQSYATADYGISAYLTEPQALYVNLYVPSQVEARLGGQAVTIAQATNYPLEATTRIGIDPAGPARFAVMLRIPAWAGPKTAVRVNGKPWGKAVPGTFLAVDRNWRKGDVVEIAFDMGLRLEPLNAAHPEMVAVMTGPLVLMPVEDTETRVRRGDWLTAVRGGPDTWTVKTAAAQVTLKPFMAIGAETYRVYNRLLA